MFLNVAVRVNRRAVHNIVMVLKLFMTIHHVLSVHSKEFEVIMVSCRSTFVASRGFTTATDRFSFLFLEECVALGLRTKMFTIS